MKRLYQILLCGLFLGVFSSGYCKESLIDNYINTIESIEYEDIANITLSHFTLTNNIKFIYESSYADTHYLHNFTKSLFSGSEILFSIQKYKQGLCICYWDVANKRWLWLRNISLHNSTKEMLPTISHKEKVSTGLFSSKWHLYLSDSSFWVIEKSWKTNLDNWKRGDQIIISKGFKEDDELYTLINLNVPHSYFDPVWDQRYDFRKIEAKFISSTKMFVEDKE